MAQGTRGRFALLGAGLLFCIGCMNDEPKPIGKQPVKPLPSTIGANPNAKAPATTYGGGIQQAGFTNTGRPDPKNEPFKTAGATFPATPGVKGNGAPFPPPLAPAGFTPQPTQPPSGFGANPPFAPDGPAGALPQPPIPPTGSYAPMQP